MHGGAYYQSVGHHHHHPHHLLNHHQHRYHHPQDHQHHSYNHQNHQPQHQSLMYPAHSSGFYGQEKSSSESYSSYGDHVTVLQIDQNANPGTQQHLNSQHHSSSMMSLPSAITKVPETDFVTVVQIASTDHSEQEQEQQIQNHLPTMSSTTSESSATRLQQRSIYVDAAQIEEEVTVYRLPGERLGMALRFDGGQTANETIRRVFVQSITANSPASKAIGLMLGILRDGDEILQIDGRHSNSLTRLECITMLRDAPVCIRLVVKRAKSIPGSNPDNYFKPILTSHSTNNIPSLFNSVETPTLMSQLLSQSTETLPRKVPPPVPPRLATTTLSIKRRPKSVCVLTANQPEIEMTVQTGDNSDLSSSAPVEKPPRRKYLNGPPPLPPRRPKCPPPKPPTERIAQIIITTTSSPVVSSCGVLNDSTNNTPIVTVISKKVKLEPLDSLSRPLVSVVSISSPQTSPINTINNKIKISEKNDSSSNNEPNVTFTITNSKVSSFIRQTAERLQRKLSGKFKDDQEQQIALKEMKNHLSCKDTLESLIVNEQEIESKKFETNTEIISRSSIAETPTEFESLTEDSNSCLESDTDDTASTVSTIVERKQSSRLSQNSLNSNTQNDLSVLFVDSSNQQQQQISNMSRKMTNIDDMIQLSANIQQTTLQNLNNVEQKQPNIIMNSFLNNEQQHQGQQHVSVDKSKQDIIEQLSLNKTNELINTEQLPVELLFETNAEYELKNDHPSSASILCEDTVQATMTSINEQEFFIHKQSIIDDDYEDMALVHKEVMSRLDDDRENEFMLNREYLAESTARFKHYHSGSELMLSSYHESHSSHSELTSILEEEEDEEENGERDENLKENEKVNRKENREKNKELEKREKEEKDHNHDHNDNDNDNDNDNNNNNDKDNDNDNNNNNNNNDNDDADDHNDNDNDDDEEDLGSDKHPSIVIVSSVDSVELLSKINSDTDADSGIKSPDGSEGESSNRSNSSQSSFNSDKMSLGNVFDFLNEANDDFEFVERMLELTNDKIDSFDDIMRIRESIKEIQMSNQRENLERFLDSNNVVDELIALSSPSTSSAHSTTSSIETESDSGESNCSTGIGKIKSVKTKKKNSLTPFINRKPDIPMKPCQLSKSKIPILDKTTALGNSLLSLHNSNSVNNISQQYNSLLELRPSLIPIAIQNSKTSMGGLNRSTSMQTISLFNSLPRPIKPNKFIPNHRRSNLNISTQILSSKQQTAVKEPISGNYGSLSRQVSKSITNVFTTGSLPRSSRTLSTRTNASPGMNTTTRTSSMVDLSNRKGLVASTSCIALTQSSDCSASSFKRNSLQQSPIKSSGQSKSCKFNNELMTSTGTTKKQRLGTGKYQTSQTKFASTSNLLQSLQDSNRSFYNKTTTKIGTTSTAAVAAAATTTELLHQSLNSHSSRCNSSMCSSYSVVSNFWNSFEKHNINTSSKIFQSPVARKILKSNNNSNNMNFTTITAPNMNPPTSTTPTRSILRCPSLRFKNDSFDSRFSDSDCSNSSSDEQNDIHYQRSNRRQSLKVCFLDEVLERDFTASPVDESDEMEQQSEDEQCISPLKDMVRHFDLPVLSSAASISSISSICSSGDSCSSASIASLKPLANMKNIRREVDSGMCASDISSEFSQSPSPDFERMKRSSIKERIAFFDASVPSAKESKEIQARSNCFVKNGVSPLLSRSCSAPYDSECTKTLATTIIEQPSTIITKGDTKNFRVEPKSFSSFSKLKGLIIPYLPEAETRTKHQLPIIKSDQLYRVPLQESSSHQAFSSNVHAIHESHMQMQPTCPPIPLRPANITVQQYSPMFKRRELSLPPTDFPVVGEQASTPIKLPPAVLPKPRKVIELEQCNIESVQEQAQSLECSSNKIQPVKPVDQLQADNELLLQDGSKVASQITLKIASKITSKIDSVIDECQIKKDTILSDTIDVSAHIKPIDFEFNIEKNNENSSDNFQDDSEVNKKNVHDSKNDKTNEESCDFIIYQRQYSMRAIMFDNVTPTNIGLTLCGGLDSKRKEVTINQIATSSVAERDGRLQIGDRIVSINGKSVMAMIHDETKDLLEQAAQSGKVLLIVSRQLEKNEKLFRELSPTATTAIVSNSLTNLSFIHTDVESKKSSCGTTEHNPGSCRLITAEIMKDFNGLGFIIEGGYSPLGDKPITIKRIFRGGPVDKEGSLVEGDELQSINDQSIAGMSRTEVWSHLKQLPDGKVSLTVRRVKRYL